jgi:hypothetical protein
VQEDHRDTPSTRGHPPAYRQELPAQGRGVDGLGVHGPGVDGLGVDGLGLEGLGVDGLGVRGLVDARGRRA